jgi:hypothetical protein
MRPSGIYSAQGIEDLMSTAKPIYKDALKNYEDGLAILFGMGARIVDTVYKHPVGIRDLSSIEEGKREQKKIKPEDIDGHYDCSVKLLAEPPEATDMRKTLGMNLWRSGLISLKTCLTQYFDMSEVEADKEIAQRAAEDALKEQGIRELMAQDAAKRLAMKQAEEAVEATQERLAGKKTPKRQPMWGETAGEAIPKRRRAGVGAEPIPSAQEQVLTGTPIG